MSIFENQIIYNNDNTVSVPFGRAAEWYILQHPLLKNTRLKSQSRLNTPQLIKEQIIKLCRVEGAVDFLEWECIGKKKSTNRIDDIIELTTKGEEYIKEIQVGIKKDKLCWSWIMYCAGDGNTCQHLCGGIGECISSCSNYNLVNNLRNGNDMHCCSVRVHSFSRLSNLNTSHPLYIKIEGCHRPSNLLNTENRQVTRINLTRQIRDKITISRRADHQTTKEIKGKLLISLNGATEEELNNALLNNREICDNKKLKRFIVREDRRLKENTGSWTILHYLIEEVLKPKGYILYYQQPDLSQPEDSAEHYYQLTVSDEFWLRNGRDFGQFCIGIDGKYDLNIDRAPILTMIVENNAQYGTPLAFGLSNKENNWSIRLAVNAVKQNIPCNNSDCNHPWHYENLSNNKGFKRIRDCNNQIWNPYIMIDKHRPSKLGVEGLVRGTILCWFHIMQTFGNNLKEWNIPQSFRYPIALGFKLIARCRTEEASFEMANNYKIFINSLPLTQEQKHSLINDLDNNWMCNEWRLQFIDAGRLPDAPNSNPMTTNNYTERMNRTIESKLSGKQTVVTFIERLYGLKLLRENLNKQGTGQITYEAGLVTFFNAKSIEQQNEPFKIKSDMKRRLNQGRLYFLLGFVEQSNYPNYYYVKKYHQSKILMDFFYNEESIELEKDNVDYLRPMMEQLTKNYNVELRDGFYITNIVTGECPLCLDYIWNSSFRDVCKHCYAARIFSMAQMNNSNIVQETKEKFVSYFKNKERVVPPDQKNNTIYLGSVDEAYNEIIRLFNIEVFLYAPEKFSSVGEVSRVFYIRIKSFFIAAHMTVRINSL
ncbi:hypothetical protein Glove_680g85 [Diversispora epigaea]|uniref:Uncharacterized protein n=1 Tax=Diversispora epigaea TaxID=1348612 RepID=A0A397GB94_9GLOM|nr:hypothetical protein Glove_680g85 [Diversispora epigaea]